MRIDLIITICIAIGGWILAIYQMRRNRQWQQKDMLANRRYDAYCSFMKKLEEINESTRANPNIVYGISNDFLKSILSGDADNISNALIRYNQRLKDYVKASTEPLMIICQEIGPLLLIASEELTSKLNQLKLLIVDYNNEMQNCLSKIDVKDSNSFKSLATIGHDVRSKELQKLNDSIIKLMRKELNIK